jgi:hypothetical protein
VRPSGKVIKGLFTKEEIQHFESDISTCNLLNEIATDCSLNKLPSSGGPNHYILSVLYSTTDPAKAGLRQTHACDAYFLLFYAYRTRKKRSIVRGGEDSPNSNAAILAYWRRLCLGSRSLFRCKCLSLGDSGVALPDLQPADTPNQIQINSLRVPTPREIYDRDVHYLLHTPSSTIPISFPPPSISLFIIASQYTTICSPIHSY